jgi:photosystem II stability/assembly factor-like uncharacterized protein
LRLPNKMLRIQIQRIALVCIVYLAAFRLVANEMWTLTTAPYANWVAAASSADGNKLVAVADGGSVYVSTNSGAVWIAATNAPSDYWVCVAISADGSKMAAAIDGGTIYTSADYGTTWKQTKAPTNYWESITCSADGTRLAAAAFSDGLNNAAPGQIHLSQNSGLDWGTPSDPATNLWQFWLSIASSADGSKLVAVNAAGSIYTSQNFGNSWSQTSAPNESWFGVASSTNGNHLVAVGNAGPIYISTNSGAMWWAATNAPVAGWAAVCSSSDGSKLAAVQWGGQVYTSVDGGIIWLPRSVPNTYDAGGIWGIAMSNHGDKIVTAGDGPWGGPVYSWQPQPILTIEETGNFNAMVNLSWPASAAGFSLQGNTALTMANWIAVSNMPAISNGRYQSLFAPSEAFQFFRLTFPTGNPPYWWPHQPPPIINY